MQTERGFEGANGPWATPKAQWCDGAAGVSAAMPHACPCGVQCVCGGGGVSGGVTWHGIGPW